MQHWTLLEQVFTVETIMTPRGQFLQWCDDEPLAEVWEKANLLNLDVIPIVKQGEIQAVFCRGNDKPMLLDSDRFVSHNQSIPTALQLLGNDNKPPFLFVTFQRTVVGLITPADFNKLAARTYFYNLLAELEMKLAALSLRFFKGNQSDLLQRLEEIYRESEKGRERLEEIYTRLHKTQQSNNEINIVHMLYLTDFINLVCRSEKFRDGLGFSSRSNAEKQLNGLVQLRNDTMHPVNLILSENRTVDKLANQLGIALELLSKWNGDVEFD